MVCKRILLIVDTPEGMSHRLADKIAGLARCLGAEVEVFDAVFDPALTDSEKVQESVERRQDELDGIVAALRERDVPAHATVLWAYPPRRGVVQQLRRYRPDLLIIRSRRHSRLARMLFTYSDYKLIETAPCPVLVIKNDHDYANCRVVAAVDPTQEHDKPAVLDEQIVALGSSVAGAMGRPLHLYHACSPWLPGAGAWQARVASRVRQLATGANIPEGCVHLVFGNAVATLPEFVENSPSDLLVMGAVSRSRLRKALIGHTAEKMLEETDCDVLIVKPAERPSARAE